MFCRYSYRSYIKEIKSCVDKYAYRNEAVKSRAENVFMKMMTEDNCQFKCKKRVAGKIKNFFQLIDLQSA